MRAGLKKAGLAAAAMTATAAIFAGTAHGAVTIGPEVTPATAAAATFTTTGCVAGGCTSVNRNVAPGRTLVSPIDGIITKWNFAQGAGGAAVINLHLMKPTLATPSSTWAGVSVVQPGIQIPGAAGFYSFASRIPIEAGVGIGLDYPNTHNVIVTSTPIGDSAYWQGGLGGMVPVPATGTQPFELQLSAVIEPDADKDGYGDDTQDACPTNGLQQSPCPVGGNTNVPPPCSVKPKQRKKKKKRSLATAAKKKKKKKRGCAAPKKRKRKKK